MFFKKFTRKNNKGQAWSIDLIIAVAIFLLAISIGFYIFENNKTHYNELKSEGELINNKLEEIGLIEGNKLNEEKLEYYLRTGGYDELKKELGVKNDFCMFLEDDQGNLVNFTIFNDEGVVLYSGLGTVKGDFNLTKKPCGFWSKK